MKCPKCNQTPIRFLRFISSTKGVRWNKAIRGHLVCDRCGSFLRVRAHQPLFWVSISLLVLLLLAETYFLRSLIPALPQSQVILVVVFSILVVGIVSGYVEWRFTELEEVPPEDRG